MTYSGDHRARGSLDFANSLKRRCPSRESSKEDVRFHSSECCAQAEVIANAKTDMGIR